MDPFKPFNSTFEFDREKGVIVLRNVRLSYPSLIRPKGFADNPEAGKRYSLAAICNFTQEKRKELSEIVVAGYKQRLGEKATLPADKLFVRRGDDTGKPENAGFTVISASEREDGKAPEVYDRNKQITRSEDACYAGCQVDIVIRPWVQDNKYGKRVNASLVAVAFRDDNTPFGAPRVDASSYLGVPSGQSLPAETPVSQHQPSQEEGGFGYAQSTYDPPAASSGDDYLPF